MQMTTPCFAIILILASSCSPRPREATPPEKLDSRAAIHLIQGQPHALSDGTTLLLTGFVVEELADAPGGEGVITRVRIDDTEVVVSELPPGYPSRTEAWAGDVRVRLADAGGLGEIDVHVDARAGKVVPGSSRRVRIDHGQTVALDGPLHLRFVSHYRAEGEADAPLDVRVEYRTAARGNDYLEDEVTHSLLLPENNTWRWRDFEIELGEFEIDRWMEVEIRRLEMKPLGSG